MHFSHDHRAERRSTNGHITLHSARAYETLTRIVWLGRRGWAYRRLVEDADVRPGDDVLDLGCGTGALTRAAAEAWNQVGNPRLRVIVHVKTPPPNLAVVADLNEMRGLERVVAEIEEPSRTGFERLHRPLGFRKVMP